MSKRKICLRKVNLCYNNSFFKIKQFHEFEIYQKGYNLIHFIQCMSYTCWNICTYSSIRHWYIHEFTLKAPRVNKIVSCVALWIVRINVLVRKSFHYMTGKDTLSILGTINPMFQEDPSYLSSRNLATTLYSERDTLQHYALAKTCPLRSDFISYFSNY